MKKIPTLYVRDGDDPSRVSEEVEPSCQWVIDEWDTDAVRATEKIDGTCCLVQDGILYRRHTVKEPRKPARATRVTPRPGLFPPGWWHYSTEPGHLRKPDETILYGPGWLPVDVALPTNRYHSEAWDELRERRLESEGPHRGKQVPAGTYELVGPKVEGNPHGLNFHRLIRHGVIELDEGPNPRPSALYVFLEVRNRGPAPLEGIVWHHADGRMAKIKAKDYGIPWKGLERLGRVGLLGATS